MRKILLGLCAAFLLAAAPPALASYSGDGSGDSLKGTLAAQQASTPFTLAAFIKVANHPTSFETYVMLGANSSSNADSLRIQANSTDNRWSAGTTNAATSITRANVDSNVDGTWVCLVGVFTTDSSRAVYIGSSATTGSSGGSNEAADTLDEISLLEALSGAEDAVVLIAEVAGWAEALDTTEIDEYCVDKKIPPLVGDTSPVFYYPLDEANSTQANEGTDSGGDLTVTGATFNADHPAMDQGSDPAEFVDVTVSAAANGYRVDYEVTGEDATVYVSVCSPGDAAPNQGELEAGQCGGGNAAWFAGNEAATADVPGDITVSEANNPVRATVYVGCAGATGDCTIETHANEDRSLRAGYLSVVLALHSAEGICGQDSYFTPDCADGDVIEYKATTEETANCAVTIEATGAVVLTPTTPGDCGGPGVRRTFKLSYQDVSNATDGLFTAPTVGNFTTDDTAAVNNSAPQYEATEAYFLWQKDVAIPSTDFNDRWSDPDGDTLTITFEDALPTGLTNTAGVLDGTPSACGASTITERATDAFDDFTENEVEMVVGELVPDFAGDDGASYAAEVEALCSFTATEAGSVYSATVALGDVVSVDPAVGELVPPDQEVTYVLSLGPRPAVDSQPSLRSTLRARRTPWGMSIH